MKSRAPIYAEQYVEVIRNKENTWDVELVIETLDKKSSPLRQNLATFDSEEEGDHYANNLRWQYDKTIFEYELM